MSEWVSELLGVGETEGGSYTSFQSANRMLPSLRDRCTEVLLFQSECMDGNNDIASLFLFLNLKLIRLRRYRIRELGDKETSGGVSKDVRKLQAYESALLKHYQAFLQYLHQVISCLLHHPCRISSIQLLTAVPFVLFRDVRSS